MKRNIVYVLLMVVLGSASAFAQKAGNGTYEPQVLKLDGAGTDNSPIIARHHYLRIEVPTWFVNNESNFLKKRIVSGTVEMTIGAESYNAVLGTFPLTGDNRVSPVFNRALVDNRVYNGGDLTIKVFIKGIKKDTAMGGLLKSLADTALNVAVGQVSTMTAFGAIPALNDASKTLIAGVKEALNNGEDQYVIFEESGGLETTFNKEKIARLGKETFFIAYRGDSLIGKQVKVVSAGQGYDIRVSGNPLRQGAWVLLRISRESTYGNSRPWTARAEQVSNDITALMREWKLGAKTVSEVKQALTATLQGNQTADKLLALRPIIESDSVLSSTEQGLEIVKLVTRLEMARAATTKADGYDDYLAELKKFEASLLAGTVPASAVAQTVVAQEFRSLEKSATDRSTDEYVEAIFKSPRGAGFAYSELEKTHDVSLMSAEQALTKSKTDVKSYLTDDAAKIRQALSSTDSDLWNRFGEMEREKKARKN